MELDYNAFSHVYRSLVPITYIPIIMYFSLPHAASNILICRPASCQCADIFCCECPMGSKCEIRISDFDSVKIFSRGLCATSVPDVQCKAKADSTKVLGTPYYRAPEVIEVHTQNTHSHTHAHLDAQTHAHACTHTHTHTHTMCSHVYGVYQSTCYT